MSKRTRDAEEIKRKKAAKERFRKLVRGVILNSTWLTDSGDQKLSLNVKKNIAMLVRTQRKVGMLTVAEKSLLRTPHWCRSIEDRKKLCTLIAGLTCFSRIPPKIRARLVPVLKFMVLNPGRVIMKENDFPITVYFIITGEVEMTKTVYDHVTQKKITRTEAIFGPGDCIGDIELVEDCLRRNTYVAISPVELLVLFDSDFNVILFPFMAKQWSERKKALKSLDYFNFLNEEQVISACTFGQLRQFDPLETIYYEDKGSVSYVHFVVSGECEILQCLNMKVTQRGNDKSFELSDLDTSNMIFQNLTKEEAMKMMRESGDKLKSDSDINELVANLDKTDGEQDQRKTTVNKRDLKAIEIECGLRKPSLQDLQKSSFNKSFYTGEDGFELITEESDDVAYSGDGEEHRMNEEIQSIKNKESSKINFSRERISKSSTKSIDTNFDVESESELFTASSSTDTKQYVTLNRLRPIKTVKQESHFIDVGSLTFGGIFGLGEKIEHRVIMARTTVQCLMLPRFWLFEKPQNPGNIWQRRRFYLDCTIPSREILFKDFLKTRKWQKFKQDYIQSNLNQNSVSNNTKTDDIPIICRIVETTDD